MTMRHRVGIIQLVCALMQALEAELYMAQQQFALLKPQVFFPLFVPPQQYHHTSNPSVSSCKLKYIRPRYSICCHFIDDREKKEKKNSSFSDADFLVLDIYSSTSPHPPYRNQIKPIKSAHSNAEDKQNIRQRPPKSPKFRRGIFTNMWWADLKAAIGQRFNLEGIICCAKVVTKNPNLALPHLTVPDIRSIDWSELHRRGFKGVVFDKDNTLTAPYVLTLWAPLKASVARCKAVFGDDNVAMFSNSAGLYEFDRDGRKARALERTIGIKVIRHKVKKPAGDAEEIEKHFGCSASKLVMVGDRCVTDVVYGNRSGLLTVWTKPLCGEEPWIVRQIRKIEEFMVKRWVRKGLKAPEHSLLLSDGKVLCVKDPAQNEGV